MGYDVTFHPVALDDVRRYVFDIIEQPGLAGDRASSLATGPETQRRVERIYGQMQEWVGQLAAGRALPLNETFAYATAQVAGVLHPYWYARNAAIGMLDDDAVQDLFTPLTKIAGVPESLHGAAESAHIGLNYTASGIVTDLNRLERQLERLGLDDNETPTLFRVFDRATLASLREAIAYCRKHGLALMEAADVVVPIANETRSDPDRLREAELFDTVQSDIRPWFEPPVAERAGAFEALETSDEALLNDTVEVRHIFRRNTVGTLVPLYLVPQLDRRKYPHPDFGAVLDAEEGVRPVRRRRIRLRERAVSNNAYLRRIFEHERFHYEQLAEEDPTAEIESAQTGIGSIPDRILNTGLFAARVGEWQLAERVFGRALRSADIVLDGKHDQRDSHAYPGNRAAVIRTRWFAKALLDQSEEGSVLAEACELHCEFAKQLRPVQWHEYAQRDYLDFVLTSLFADRPDLTRQMLEFPRPFDEHGELRRTYADIADIGSRPAGRPALLERCMQLLEVIRHPQGGRFLSFSTLTGIQLAMVAGRDLAEEGMWAGMRDIVSWFGR